MLKPSAWPGPGAGLPQKQKPSATASVWHYETLKCQTERLHNSRTFIIIEYFIDRTSTCKDIRTILDKRSINDKSERRQRKEFQISATPSKNTRRHARPRKYQGKREAYPSRAGRCESGGFKRVAKAFHHVASTCPVLSCPGPHKPNGKHFLSMP